MATAQVSPKRWTFMVYMAGDNSLDSEGDKDLKEMKKVGSSPDLNLIVQRDRASGHATKRNYIKKGGKIADNAVASLGKVNTGDLNRLFEFIK